MIWYIHGANASPTSFNYLKDGLRGHDHKMFRYTVDRPARDNLRQLLAEIDQDTKPFSIVSHSMGGLFAVLAAAHFRDRVKHVFTVSTPFAGCESAVFLQLWSKCQLLTDIHPHSEFVRAVRRCAPMEKMTTVITTGGSVPFMSSDNDGVVTVKSQDSLGYGEKFRFKYNHSEILQTPELRFLVKERLLRA